MNKSVGYARVVASEQDAEPISNALISAGCSESFIFIDQVAPDSLECPAFQSCLKCLNRGDILIVWRLQCPVRSLPHLFVHSEVYSNQETLRIC